MDKQRETAEIARNTFLQNNMYYGDFGESNNLGSEQKGIRPFVVLQNNVGNHYSGTLIVAPISQLKEMNFTTRKKKQDTHVSLSRMNYPLLKGDSVILTEQIRTISKKRVVSDSVGQLIFQDRERLNAALHLSLGLVPLVFNSNTVVRGQIYLADLGKGLGNEFKGYVPVVVVQNDIGNYYSSTVIIAPINLKATDTKLQTQVLLKKSEETNITCSSIIHTEQLRTIDKVRLISKIGKVSIQTLNEINAAISFSLNMTS